MKKLNSTYSILFLLLICFSCSKEENNIITIEDALFVYMAADNDLDFYAINNINQLEDYVFNHKNKGAIYVYLDRAKERKTAHPTIYKIKGDTTKIIVSEIIQVYPEQNSSDANTFLKVLKDVNEYASENNERIRGLSLWSHGSAWLLNTKNLVSNRAENNDDKSFRSLKGTSFGIDETIIENETYSEMNIKSLANKLKGYHFEYLIFDACFMSSIEVAYELKENFDYIIASPTEILADGFPYNNILPELFKKDIDYKKITENYVKFYNKKKGILKSAAAVTIKTSALKGFATSMRLHLEKEIKKNVNLQDKLQYDQLSSNWLFDLKQVINEVGNNMINSKLEEVIINYNHTEKFYNKIDLSNSSGISIYIPNNKEKRTTEHEFYKTLSWNKDSGFDIFFDNTYNIILSKRSTNK